MLFSSRIVFILPTTADGEMGTHTMPNRLSRSASFAITLMKGTGLSPILAMRRPFTAFTTAAVLRKFS